MITAPVRIEPMPHCWWDISHHGSPTWECKYCGTLQDKDNLKENCPQILSAYNQQQAQVFNEERIEYERIKYLLNKFDGN